MEVERQGAFSSIVSALKLKAQRCAPYCPYLPSVVWVTAVNIREGRAGKDVNDGLNSAFAFVELVESSVAKIIASSRSKHEDEKLAQRSKLINYNMGPSPACYPRFHSLISPL